MILRLKHFFIAMPYLCSQFNSSSLPFTFKTVVSSLGVRMDSALKLEVHVNYFVRSCFSHLRRLAKVKPILRKSHIKSIIHAFVTSYLDLANSVVYGINSTISQLQLVVRRREHITSVLTDIYWLSIQFRIEFKILLFVFKSLHGVVLAYLSASLLPYLPSRSLWSADQLSQYRMFAMKVWDSVPSCSTAHPLCVRRSSSL